VKQAVWKLENIFLSTLRLAIFTPVFEWSDLDRMACLAPLYAQKCARKIGVCAQKNDIEPASA
jgi:hypothetical protein